MNKINEQNWQEMKALATTQPAGWQSERLPLEMNRVAFMRDLELRLQTFEGDKTRLWFQPLYDRAPDKELISRIAWSVYYRSPGINHILCGTLDVTVYEYTDSYIEVTISASRQRAGGNEGNSEQVAEGVVELAKSLEAWVKGLYKYAGYRPQEGALLRTEGITKVVTIDPKPALVRSEQIRQDHLLEREPIEVQFPGRVARRIPVTMPAEQFLEWFPNRVYDMYAHWRLGNIDTSKAGSGPGWCAFHLGPQTWLWINMPKTVSGNVLAAKGGGVLSMQGELWEQLPEGKAPPDYTNVHLVSDRWYGLGFGHVFWFEVYAKGQNCEVRALCAKYWSKDANVIRHFEELCRLIEGEPAKGKLATQPVDLLARLPARKPNPPGPRKMAATNFVEERYVEGISATDIVEKYGSEIRRLRAEVDRDAIEMHQVPSFVENCINNLLKKRKLLAAPKTRNLLRSG